MDMVQKIDRFCSLANELVTQSLIAGSCVTQAHELCDIAEAATLAQNRIRERCTMLIEIEKRLRENLTKLRESVADMERLYQFSLNDMGGRSVFADLQDLNCKVQNWIRASLAFLILDDTAKKGLTPELVKTCNDLANSFPLTLSGGVDLEHQINVARSILFNNIAACSNLFGQKETLEPDALPESPAPVREYSKPFRVSTWHKCFKDAKYSENESYRSFSDWVADQVDRKNATRATKRGPICFDVEFLKAYGVKLP